MPPNKEKDDSNTLENNANGNGGDPNTSYETFDDFLGEQDEDIQNLYEANVQNLKSALQKERDARKSLSDEMKELQGKAEDGSELQKTLDEKVQKLEKAEAEFAEAQRKLDFMEKAVSADVGCKRPKAAWALAITEDYFDKDGNPEWDKLREEAPELFNKTSTDAGKSTPVTGADINAEIRRKAGVRSR